MINPTNGICKNYITLVTASSSAQEINEFKITKLQLVMDLPFVKSYWSLVIIDRFDRLYIR